MSVRTPIHTLLCTPAPAPPPHPLSEDYTLLQEGELGVRAVVDILGEAEETGVSGVFDVFE